MVIKKKLISEKIIEKEINGKDDIKIISTYKYGNGGIF